MLEELIVVAEGEMRLADTMIKNKVYVLLPLRTSNTMKGYADTCDRWEQLEEQAPEGQWTYFERGPHSAIPNAHTATQKPAPP